MSFTNVEKSSANNYGHSMKDQFQRFAYNRSEEVSLPVMFTAVLLTP